MEQEKKQESMVCPNCGHLGLNYGDSGVNDDNYVYDWECPACKYTGEEWCDIVFSHHANIKAPVIEEPVYDTDFLKVQQVSEIWLKEEIKRGFISAEMQVRLTKLLGLKKRDKTSLQNLRDFAVLYLTTRFEDRSPNADILRDCMSAVTHIIDDYLFSMR